MQTCEKENARFIDYGPAARGGFSMEKVATESNKADQKEPFASAAATPFEANRTKYLVGDQHALMAKEISPLLMPFSLVSYIPLP